MRAILTALLLSRLSSALSYLVKMPADLLFGTPGDKNFKPTCQSGWEVHLLALFLLGVMDAEEGRSQM
jgi:hypothetical protein